MNPYILLGAALGAGPATELSQRLAAWHDAMVGHNRRLESGRGDDECGDDCAHGEARALWAEALSTFGHRAHELAFLRASATHSAGRNPAGRRAGIRRLPAEAAAESKEA